MNNSTWLPDKTRRNFLKQLMVGTAAVALPSFAKASAGTPPFDRASEGTPPLTGSGSEGEPYWEMVKKQFIVPPKLMMMNAANLCPSPYFIIEQVQAGQKDLGQDVSFQFRDRYGDIREKSLEKMAQYLGVTKEEVGITRNTSESNNIIVNGFDFKSGDEVILWDQNHDSNGIAWQQRAKRFGFTVKTIAMPANPKTIDDLIDPWAKAITPKTRLIAFSHISNLTGIALPAKEICAMARQKGVLTHVDGAQSFGFLDLNLKDLGCDFYSGSTHKWLMGPFENGVLYIRRELMPRVWPLIITAGWKENRQTVDEKYCVLGQRNETTPAALPETLDFHYTLGKKNVEARVRQLNAYLKEKLQAKFPTAVFATPMSPALSGGIVVVNFPGKSITEIYNKLYTDHGIAAAPQGAGVRFSPNVYNTMGDMERVVEGVI